MRTTDQKGRVGRRAAVIATALTIPFAALAANAAQAAPERDPAGNGAAAAAAKSVPVSAPAEVTKDAGRRAGEDAATAAVRYWTPERMRAATPAVPPTSKAPASQAAAAAAPGTPVDYPAAAPPKQVLAAARKAAGKVGTTAVTFTPVAGRVFFVNQVTGHGHWCSGSATNSPSKRLVLTAGHCVHGGEGGKYHRNWVFYPGYQNGNPGPAGEFPALLYQTFQDWVDDSDLDADVAFVVTKPNAAGKKVVTAVGGNGLAINAGRFISTTILAYPADDPYDGRTQQYCQGTTWLTPVPWFDAISVTCGFTGGSSGGGWIKDYNNTTRVGHAHGVMSTLVPVIGVNTSPYFDEDVKKLFDLVANRES